MGKRKRNSLIPDTQNDINGFSELTSSELQKDFDCDTSVQNLSFNKKINVELLEYKIQHLEQNVEELKKEIQQPIFEKLTKYKWILGLVGTLLSAIFIVLTWCFHLYNKNLDIKFHGLEEKLNENIKNTKEHSKSISELNNKTNIIDYSVNINRQK